MEYSASGQGPSFFKTRRCQAARTGFFKERMFYLQIIIDWICLARGGNRSRVGRLT